MEHIHITPEGIVELQNVTVHKRMPIAQFARELNNYIGSYDTPMLPFGTIKYQKVPFQTTSKTSVAFVIQPRLIRIRFNGDMKPFATPYMIYFFKATGNSRFSVYRLFSLTQFISTNTQLYISNLPNTYDDGRLCTGRVSLNHMTSENILDNIIPLIGTLESSDFNTDLRMNTPRIVSEFPDYGGSIAEAVNIWSSLSEENPEPFWTLDSDVGFVQAGTFQHAWEAFNVRN